LAVHCPHGYAAELPRELISLLSAIHIRIYMSTSIAIRADAWYNKAAD